MRRGTGEIICFGGAAVDRKYRCCAPVVLETSNPATSQYGFGGVARNVAENLARLGADVTLVSMLGNDEFGRAIARRLEEAGVDTSLCQFSPDHATAEYVAIFDPGGALALGVANMEILEACHPGRFREAWARLPHAAWIFADCNLPQETLSIIIDLALRNEVPLAVDAVSTAKVLRLPLDLTGVDTLFLNMEEATALLGEDGNTDVTMTDAASALLKRGTARVVVTDGTNGVVAADGKTLQRIQAIPAEVVDVTGAGDALIAATLLGRLQGRSLAEAVRLGTMAATLTIEHPASVRHDLSSAMVMARLSHS